MLQIFVRINEDFVSVSVRIFPLFAEDAILDEKLMADRIVVDNQQRTLLPIWSSDFFRPHDPGEIDPPKIFHDEQGQLAQDALGSELADQFA